MIDPSTVVGVLGGTFDPIHRGHLRIAERALGRLRLARVLLLPTAVPPHKAAASLSSVEHRLAMVRLALGRRDWLEICLLELSEDRPCYTIDTMRTLRDEHGLRPLFIVGMDALCQITSWRSYRSLLSEFDMIAIDRYERELCGEERRLDPEVTRRLVRLPESVPDSGSSERNHPGSGGRIFHIAGAPIPISSSEIRRRAARGEVLMDLVPPPVAEYIQSMGLYRTEVAR